MILGEKEREKKSIVLISNSSVYLSVCYGLFSRRPEKERKMLLFTGVNAKPDGDVIHWPSADVRRVKQAENFACPFSAPYFLPFFTLAPDSLTSLLLPPLLLLEGGGGGGASGFQ